MCKEIKIEKDWPRRGLGKLLLDRFLADLSLYFLLVNHFYPSGLHTKQRFYYFCRKSFFYDLRIEPISKNIQLCRGLLTASVELCLHERIKGFKRALCWSRKPNSRIFKKTPRVAAELCVSTGQGIFLPDGRPDEGILLFMDAQYGICFVAKRQ